MKKRGREEEEKKIIPDSLSIAESRFPPSLRHNGHKILPHHQSAFTVEHGLKNWQVDLVDLDSPMVQYGLGYGTLPS